MEIESVFVEVAEEKHRKKGILGFAEIVLCDENDRVKLSGIKIIRAVGNKRIKICYPYLRTKTGKYTLVTPLGAFQRKVNDAILKKFSEVCRLEDLLTFFA